MWANVLHLNPRLRFDVADEIFALFHGQALVSFFIGLLELHIGRRARSSQNCHPVLEYVALIERSMTIGFGEFVRVQVLASSFAPPNEEQMIGPKRCRVWHSESTIDDHSPRNSPFGDGVPKRDPLARLVDQNVCEASPDQEQRKDRAGANEGKKVAVIPPANTVVQPNTVVVKGFNTVIADTAVIAARRPPDVTCFAVLNRHIHSGYIRCSKLDHDPIVCWRTERERVVSGIRGRHRVYVPRHDPGIDDRCVHKGREANVENIGE